MNRMSEMTLGDVGRALTRYRPFIAVVAAIVLVAVFLPGHAKNPPAGTDALNVNNPGGLAQQPGQTPTGTVPGQTATGAVPGQTGALPPGSTGSTGSTGSLGGTSTSSGGTTSPGSAPGQAGYVPPPAGTISSGTKVDANCDPLTHRIKFPSLYAPPCVPAFNGNNGGATYQGVTKDAIHVAVYLPQVSAASKAVLVASGDKDSQDDVYNDYVQFGKLLEKHYQTYGRHLVFHRVDGSGDATDETAGRADAVKIAKQIKAFMAWTTTTPVDAFTNELTRDHVLCMCTVTLPANYYLRHAPYVWGVGLPDENQAYLMRAEVIAKAIAGKKAEFAGDPLLQQKTRSFGLIWYNTPQNAYGEGEKFFESELAKRGVKLAAQASYTFEPQNAQQDSDTIIQRMKSKGVTSVIFVGDPIYPSFYTSAATRQQYQPEWIVTGSALTDEVSFARVYDQTQWRHAFGLGLLSVRTENQSDQEAFRVYRWGYGTQPPGPGTASALYPLIQTSFIGFQLAGPRLNPSTFQQGLFSYPVSPDHPSITLNRISWGTKVWSYPDYNVADDGTLLYWDPSASGPDEHGAQGTGMYRYLFGGKRYLVGQFPSNIPWFKSAGTVTVLSSVPKEDRPRDYSNKCAYLCGH